MISLMLTMPVVLTSQELIDMTCECLRGIKPGATETTICICVNQLSGVAPADLQGILQPHSEAPLLLLFGDRSIAGSWNEGCQQGLARGVDLLAVMANDTMLQPQCLELMVAFGMSAEGAGVNAWGGLGINYFTPWAPYNVDPATTLGVFAGCWLTEGVDFTFAMFRPSTLARFGWFDENYHPAYYEDSDYLARIAIGGGHARTLHAVQFVHFCNSTYKQDPNQARQVDERLHANWAYFREKWGAAPVHGADQMRATYHPTPFNRPNLGLDFWPQLYPEAW